MGHILTWVSVILATLSLFVFPAGITFGLLFFVGFFIPPAALVLGIGYDALYYVGASHAWPLGTLLGLSAFIVGALVRRFVKTRIMES